MPGECKVYEVVVPEPLQYAKVIAPEVDFYTLDSVESVVYARLGGLMIKQKRGTISPEEQRLLETLDKLPPEQAYCVMKGYDAVLVLKKDGRTEDPYETVVVYGLSRDAAERTVREIEEYKKAIRAAADVLDRTPGAEDEEAEFLERCYRLFGGRPRECLEEARRIISGQNVVPA
mgnify:CR=1 FL=1